MYWSANNFISIIQSLVLKQVRHLYTHCMVKLIHIYMYIHMYIYVHICKKMDHDTLFLSCKVWY
jgi:hypothetical protein